METNVIVELSNGTKLSLDKLLQVNEADLSNDFAQQASLYGWVGVMVAEAEYALSVAKTMRDEVMADLDGYYRDECEKEGKKVTETVIASLIKLDVDYQDATDKMQGAEGEYRKLRAVHDALRMRADMLVSLGAHIRAEQDMTGMKINTTDKAVDKVKEALKSRG